MFPAAAFDSIHIGEANILLARWQHKMGPLERGNTDDEHAHALFVHGEPVGVATTSSLVREHVGGGLSYINRANGVELSRLCAANPWACRVVLRLWREVVFPGLHRQYAISYQDKNLHTGATYRNDGWKRLAYSSSGTDSRSGRKGRQKWIWVWERPDVKELAA